MTGTCNASLDQSIADFLGSELTSLDENSDNYQNSLTGPTKKKYKKHLFVIYTITNYFWIEYYTKLTDFAFFPVI